MLERIIYPLVIASFLGAAKPVYATPPEAQQEEQEPAPAYTTPPQQDQPAPGRAYYIDPKKRKARKKEGPKLAYDTQTPAPPPAYVQPAPEIPEEKKSHAGDWALLGGGLVATVLGAALATSETCAQDAGTAGQKECSANAGTYAGYILVAGGAGMGLVGLLGLLE